MAAFSNLEITRASIFTITISTITIYYTYTIIYYLDSNEFKWRAEAEVTDC